MSKKGINLSNLAFDTAIDAYVINPQRTDFSLSALTNDILNIMLFLYLKSLDGVKIMPRPIKDNKNFEISRSIVYN